MTPKRLRLIARIIAEGVPAGSASSLALADELETHAAELENSKEKDVIDITVHGGVSGAVAEFIQQSQKTVRVKEPFPNPLPKASEGMR